jgi:seryl-tRNA(Sec) selenium transferase
MLLKVHRSNLEIRGFTAEGSIADLAALAAPRGIPVV